MTTFDDVLRELDLLAAHPAPSVRRGWPVATVLLHCAQSIDASIAGYPLLKPTLVRKTLGRIVARRFLARGRMRHDLEAPVPGAPPIDGGRDLPSALAALRGALARFRGHEGALQPHFLFDDLDKDAYERIHAMHIADHLRALQYLDAPAQRTPGEAAGR